MIGPDPTLRRTATIFRTEASGGRPARRMRGRIALLIVEAALASGAISFAYAQNNPPAFTPPPASEATSPTVPCLPAGQDLVMPPEIDASDGVLKGIICHGMWLVAPMPELVRGRKVVAHNNLIGDVRNMGAIYTDRDVVIDGDLVTGRSGPLCHLFARTIIDMVAER